MNTQNDHDAAASTSCSLSPPENAERPRNTDSPSRLTNNPAVEREDSITTIDDANIVTTQINEPHSKTITITDSGSRIEADANGPAVVGQKNRKHFSMPSLSNDSLDSVVQTYRAHFAPPEPVVQDENGPKHPLDVAWKQQTLPAWQPQYRPATIVSVFLGLSVLMLSIGIPMLLTMNHAKEVVVDYTDCLSNILQQNGKNITCAEMLENHYRYPAENSCSCTVKFDIPIELKTPVFIYYELEGFYQNHRRYVASVDYNQLYGKDVPLSTLQSNCEPYAISKTDSKPYGPCGAIANSLFSDEFSLLDLAGNKIDIETTGITWPTDKAFRFGNPPDWSKYAKPINWSVPANELDMHNKENNGYKNEHFIVWMRTAAFPTFRKLWGRILPKSSFDKLQNGTYTLKIDYKYKTVQNKLRIPKRFVIATSTWLGGRNIFLPILYIFCGSISFMAGIYFLILTKRIIAQERHHTHAVSMAAGTYQTMRKSSTIF